MYFTIGCKGDPGPADKLPRVSGIENAKNEAPINLPTSTDEFCFVETVRPNKDRTICFNGRIQKLANMKR